MRMCGLKQQPICASLCDGDPIIFACLKQVLHFLQPRLATLTSLAGFCIFQPAPSRLQHFSARPPAWFSGRLKSPDFRQAGSLAARQAQPSFSLLRLCSPSGGPRPSAFSRCASAPRPGGSTAALSCIWRVTFFRWKSFSFGTLIDIDNPTSGPLSILVSTLSKERASPLENGEIGRRRFVWAIS